MMKFQNLKRTASMSIQGTINEAPCCYGKRRRERRPEVQSRLLAVSFVFFAPAFNLKYFRVTSPHPTPTKSSPFRYSFKRYLLWETFLHFPGQVKFGFSYAYCLVWFHFYGTLILPFNYLPFCPDLGWVVDSRGHNCILIILGSVKYQALCK